MSPTKASLARFNLGLLPPSRYPDNWKNVGTNGHGLIKSQASISDDTNGQVQGSPGAPGFFADLATQAIALEAHGHVSFAASSSPTTRRRNHGPSKKARLAEVEDTRASPPEEAREGGNEAQYSDHEARTHNGNAVFRSDVIDGNPTAFTPQILSTPTRSGTLAAVSGMGLGEDGEPSLPSTPVHLGLEKPPERPKGLLLSSSSKRTKRKGITSAKSSPLKHQVDTTVRSPTGLCPSTEGLGSRTYIANTPRPPLTKTEVSIARMRESLANLEQQLQQIETFLIQQLLLSDWAHIDGESAKEISKLKKEVSSKGVQVIRVRQELQEAELANGTSANLVVAEPRNMIARGQNL